MGRPKIRLEPWGRDDLELLRECVGDPAMMEHLGGPESEQKILERQQRYEPPGSGQFKIVDQRSEAGVGWVGYWDRDSPGEQVYEVGWAVIPEFQGRGIARAATRELLELARREGGRRYVHAYPSVSNRPSNALCQALGFELLGESEFEYPPGTPMRCNDWRFDLVVDPEPQ
ncbi:MAG: GNAT family N-acetyltransferase [Actinomycetota bacterium]|nr:GNAT family N-acetyltransferase [Actinomycetota bacterium]